MVPKLISTYPLISDQINKQALSVVLQALEETLDAAVPGDIVEFGCYIGTTSLFMRRLMDIHTASKQLYAYDSFEGLPPKTTQDQNAAGINFKEGELRVSKKQFLEQFKRARLHPPITHIAWFTDLTAQQLPEEISFAFMDGDFYQSIIDSLHIVWPRISKGGIIAVDDYKRETLPGVEQALHDFFKDKSYHLRAAHNIAIITV